MSYLAYGKFVAGVDTGSEQEAAEHYGIAFSIGQILFWGEEALSVLGDGKWPVPGEGGVSDSPDPSFTSAAEDEERAVASPVLQRELLSANRGSASGGNSSPLQVPSALRAVRLPGSGTPPLLSKVPVPVA